MTWDPSVIDHEIDPDTWHECDNPPMHDDLRFNEVGKYNYHVKSLDLEPQDTFYDSMPE